MNSNTETAASSTALPAQKYTREEILEWYNNQIHPDEQRKRKLNTGCPAYPKTEVTFGPSYDQRLDGERLGTQLEVIAEVMLDAFNRGVWLSLAEIEERTSYPQASISAQLRHLRKPKFGGHTVDKRRRGGGRGGTWEFIVYPNKIGGIVNEVPCSENPAQLQDSEVDDPVLVASHPQP